MPWPKLPRILGPAMLKGFRLGLRGRGEDREALLENANLPIPNQEQLKNLDFALLQMRDAFAECNVGKVPPTNEQKANVELAFENFSAAYFEAVFAMLPSELTSGTKALFDFKELKKLDNIGEFAEQLQRRIAGLKQESDPMINGEIGGDSFRVMESEKYEHLGAERAALITVRRDLLQFQKQWLTINPNPTKNESRDIVYPAAAACAYKLVRFLKASARILKKTASGAGEGALDHAKRGESKVAEYVPLLIPVFVAGVVRGTLGFVLSAGAAFASAVRDEVQPKAAAKASILDGIDATWETMGKLMRAKADDPDPDSYSTTLSSRSSRSSFRSP